MNQQDFAESYTPTMRSSDMVKFVKYLNIVIYIIQIRNGV